MNLFDSEMQERFAAQFPTCHFIFLRCVDSTNTQCKQLYRNSGLQNHVVVADQQTAGRGRRSNQWQSAEGVNIYLSLAFHNRNQRDVAWLNFFFGIAIYEAIEELYGHFDGRLTLKWPNDVYIGERKLAGILIENIDNTLEWVIAGIGINVYADASQIPATATSLALEIRGTTDGAMRSAILRQLLTRIIAFPQHGLDCRTKFWQYSELTRKQPYTYTFPSGSYTGVLRDLYDDGNIAIATAEHSMLTSFTRE